MLTTTLSTLAVVISLWLLSNHVQKKLYKVPGPLIRSLSSWPRIWSVYKGKSHDDDIVLHHRYGPVVRIAPSMVSVNDPEAIPKLYGIGTKFYKSGFYALAQAHDEEGLLPDPFILTDKALHTRIKKSAANAYSLNGLVKMEAWIDPVTERLFRLLDPYAENQKSLELGDVLSNYAMDAVFALTFGEDMDFLTNGDKSGIQKIIAQATTYLAVGGQIPWVHPFLLGNSFVSRLIFGNTSPEGDIVRLAEIKMAAGLEKESREGPMTFLQQLLLNQASNPSALTDREVVTHSFGNIAAGSDTTATAMRSILFNILQNPDIYETLCAEVRENLTIPVSWSAVKDLPFLSAVIKEGIRLHPSVGMILGRIVPAGGAEICGYHLQPGVEVGVNPWIVQRDPQVFQDPDRFWPERWLEKISSEEQLRLMNRSFLAFGHGAHTCSGRWISTMEIHKLIPSLLLRYDLALSDDGRGYKFVNHWFTVQSGLNVVIRKRK
ncbi:cytochrome P450 oxidoreductase [Lophiostoma macrostomum CBS 122681]|uniref:Cytochrome P450 oxidoreductase n=1 Tax=Lophiostoma macrostomum CBS 122681 TaxID=1314788 RepID=A0A6A6STS3_9PLEO|nr:cytochrome P450 oxidoreductase [Lophiostoma macrostomum CBS 122681]